MSKTKEKENEKEEDGAEPTGSVAASAGGGATQPKQSNSSPSPAHKPQTIAENENPQTEQTDMEKTIDGDNKDFESESVEKRSTEDSPQPANPVEENQHSGEVNAETSTDVIEKAKELSSNDQAGDKDTKVSTKDVENAKPTVDVKVKPSKVSRAKTGNVGDNATSSHVEPVTPLIVSSDIQVEFGNGGEMKSEAAEKNLITPADNGNSETKHSFFFDDSYLSEGNESGTEEDQSSFMKELDNFFKERNMEFKPPKFYGEGLNCLKLWRAVMRLGGYDKVTSSKLWRQVGESFKPPKTCTTVSWTFRGFYEKALLDYERHKTHGSELSVPVPSQSEITNVDNQALGSGRARRDAAARAMQGWHSRLLGNGEVSDPIIKDKSSSSLPKREKQLKTIGLLKRKKPTEMDTAVKAARTKTSKSQLDTEVVDIGPPAEWVKINVQKTKDCYEVYALVPGLLREEVRVQSDPAGRLVIFGEPEHADNPWGVTAFKKIVTLPSRIDPHQTSAVVTLHGQLFIRVPFEQAE